MKRMTMATHRHPLDSATAERLAAGRLDPDDAPPGYRRVASLLQTAGTAPSGSVSADGTAAGALAAAIRSELAANPPRTSRRPRMLSKLTVGKALVAALSAATLSAGAAGAATGHLPDAVQDKVANAVEHVGVNLPHSDHAAGKGVQRVTDACVPAADGTYARNRGQYLAQERAKGADALAAAEKTRCGMPVQSKGTPGADDAPGAPATPEATNSDHGKSGETHGSPATDRPDPASVTTPNSGGLDTAGTASHGADSTGADTANPAATNGSGNAGGHPAPTDHPGGRP
jgi:hypothetical protein